MRTYDEDDKRYMEYQEWLKTPEGIAYLESPEYAYFKKIFNKVFKEVLVSSGVLKVIHR